MDETAGPAGSPAGRGATLGRSLRLALTVALLGALFLVAVRAIDLDRFAQAMRAADLRLVALAGVIAVTVCMVSCSLRLWLLTVRLPAAGQGVSFWQMTSVYVASSAAHHLLPAPAAEVLRTVHLRRRYGYSVGGLVAVQVVERVVDALGLALELGVVAVLVELPRALRASLGAFVGLVMAGVALVVVLAIRHGRAQVTVAERALAESPSLLGRTRAALRGFFERLSEGVYLTRQPRTWIASLACSVVNDAANVATFGLALASVGVSLPVAAWFVGVLAARLAGLVPSTPGQVGVVEAALVLVLGAFGVDRERALAVGLLYHVAHFVPVTLVGLWEMRRQLREEVAA